MVGLLRVAAGEASSRRAPWRGFHDACRAARGRRTSRVGWCRPAPRRHAHDRGKRVLEHRRPRRPDGHRCGGDTVPLRRSRPDALGLVRASAEPDRHFRHLRFRHRARPDQAARRAHRARRDRGRGKPDAHRPRPAHGARHGGCFDPRCAGARLGRAWPRGDAGRARRGAVRPLRALRRRALRHSQCGPVGSDLRVSEVPGGEPRQHADPGPVLHRAARRAARGRQPRRGDGGAGRVPHRDDDLLLAHLRRRNAEPAHRPRGMARCARARTPRRLDDGVQPGVAGADVCRPLPRGLHVVGGGGRLVRDAERPARALFSGHGCGDEHGVSRDVGVVPGRCGLRGDAGAPVPSSRSPPSCSCRRWSRRRSAAKS